MNNTSIRTNPSHWRARAAEARLNAQQVADEGAKRAMLSVAAQYDRIAERLTLQLADESTPTVGSPGTELEFAL